MRQNQFSTADSDGGDTTRYYVAASRGPRSLTASFAYDPRNRRVWQVAVWYGRLLGPVTLATFQTAGALCNVLG